MADLNALIAQGAQFKQPESPLNMMAQLQQMQSAQNQNALAQYQLGAAQRADVSKTALNAAYTKAIDPVTGKINYTQLTSALAAGGGGAEIPGLLKQQREGMKAENEAAKAEVELVDSKLKQSRGLLDTVSTPDQYLAWHEANHADPVLGPVLTARGITADKARAQIMAALQKPGGFEQLLNQSKLGTEKFMEMNKPSIHAQDTGAGGQLVSTPGLGGAATVVPGSTYTKTATPGELLTASTAAAGQRVTERGQDITAATAKAGQGVTMRGQNLLDTREKENIAIRQEDQRRKGDPVFQQQIAQATATGQAIAKDAALAQQVLPKVLETANQTINQIDALIGKRDEKGTLIKGAAPHPGFENVVGATYIPGARFIPGTAASDFQARFDQIKGGAFLQAFETLKGGGSITETEGTKGTAALNRMNTAQSEKEFVTAAKEFQDVIRKGVERAKVRVGGSSNVVDFGSLK